MTWQTILIVTACVFSLIAISVAFWASKQAGETESLAWRLNKEDHESRMREIGNREQISYRLYALEAKGREFEKRINSITEKKDCEPRRPRSYVTLGEGDGKILVALPERKKDLFKEDFKPHKVDEYCVGCNNLIALGGKKPACALDRKCKDYEVEGK